LSTAVPRKCQTSIGGYKLGGCKKLSNTQWSTNIMAWTSALPCKFQSGYLPFTNLLSKKFSLLDMQNNLICSVSNSQSPL